MNSVNLIGHTGKEPEMKYFESGSIKTTFSIAVRKSEAETNWFDCECWSKTAEFAGEYIKKGSHVAITGRLDVQKWEKDGVKHSKVIIIADRIKLLDKKES